MTESIYAKAMRLARERKQEEVTSRLTEDTLKLDSAVKSMAEKGHSVDAQIADLLKHA